MKTQSSLLDSDGGAIGVASSLGASTWRADPGHGGLEMGSADICVRAVGMEVRWWCSPPLFLGRAVRIRRRCGGGAGWLALYSRGAVVALRECTESSLR